RMQSHPCSALFPYTTLFRSVAGNVGGTLLFLAFSFTLGRRLVFKVIQFTNDHFRGEAPVVAAILVIMGGFALITQLIGVHTVLRSEEHTSELQSLAYLVCRL